MTVYEAVQKNNKTWTEVRIYVQELNDEEWRRPQKYWDSEVLNIYDHNGDMVCEVAAAK